MRFRQRCLQAMCQQNRGTRQDAWDTRHMVAAHAYATGLCDHPPHELFCRAKPAAHLVQLMALEQAVQLAEQAMTDLGGVGVKERRE